MEPPPEFNQLVRVSDLGDNPYITFAWVDSELVTETTISTDLSDHHGEVNLRPIFIRAAPGLAVVKDISGRATVRPTESIIETAIE